VNFIEAPARHKGILIHLTIAGDGCFAMVGRRRLEAKDWPTLRDKIDAELGA
jgi:hypothetical protein